LMMSSSDLVTSRNWCVFRSVIETGACHLKCSRPVRLRCRFKTMNITYLITPLIMLGMVACKALSYALFWLWVKRENHLQWFTSEIFSGRGYWLEGSKDSSQRKSLSTHTISSSAGLREVYQGILYFSTKFQRCHRKNSR
jgi:hypothetical protein